MTVEGVLFVLLLASIPGDWVVFGILLREALRPPFLISLGLMALLTGLISLGLTAYVLAVSNATFGYVFPKEVAQIGLRTAFVGFAVFPYLFLYLYRTGKFKRDGGDQ